MAIGTLKNVATLLKWAVVRQMIVDVLKTDHLFEKKLSKVYHHHKDRQIPRQIPK